MFNIQDVDDLGILLRLASRSQRHVRLADAGAPDSILTAEKKLLTEAAREWVRRYPDTVDRTSPDLRLES